MKKEYSGLKLERIVFPNSFETSAESVRVQSGCYSIMAYTQGPQGSQQWQLCQDAVAGGSDGNFAEWWVLPKEIYS